MSDDLAATPPATAIPEPPWRTPRPAPRAQREPLSRDAIVAAAVRVLDRDGLEGLSMRRVADALGVAPASLYWHVRNKDELLQFVSEALTAAAVLPPPDPSRWREQLRDVALQVREAGKRHRDLARITLGRVPWGPDLARLNEWMFALLTPAGVPDRVVALAGDMAALYTAAFGYEESLGLASPTGEPMEPEAVMAMFRQYLLSLPAQQFPHLHRAVDALFAGDADERFAFGIDLIIRGIATYAHEAEGSARQPGAQGDTG